MTLSDSCQLPRCLENCRASCNVNGLDKVKVIGITWGQISPDLMELEQVDIILGSDCFYDTKGISLSKLESWDFSNITFFKVFTHSHFKIRFFHDT